MQQAVTKPSIAELTFKNMQNTLFWFVLPDYMESNEAIT